jgi:hypothetical protein
MEIFGKHIFGSDAEIWLKLCKEEKKQWILKRTNQKDENLIDEFINNPNITKECKCLNCGKNGNISKTIPTEITTDTQSIDNAELSKGDNTKRPRTTKRAKN